jgi:phage terminase large subunit-like protein
VNEQRKDNVNAAELIRLCAPGIDLYSRTFFPKTVKQKSPAFHEEIAKAVENPDNRYVSVEIFRGGAKTTILRLITSKRIAYGISRLILYVSETQNHSIRSLRWIKRQVEYNTLWTQVYGLRRGDKWTDEEIQIVHTVENVVIHIVAVGITGQTRGLNIEDARPDLIIVDDPADEENTATDEARKKVSDIFFGSLAKSLAPPTECPDAKIVLLQTPLARGDLITSCAKDPQWRHIKFSCFNDDGFSVWPERFETEWLKEEKQAHINRGQLALWLKEMECQLISSELAQFPAARLQYWDILPEGMITVVSIDPVPPPSQKQIGVGLKGKDYEVLSVVGVKNGNFYLCAYELSNAHNPDWTVAKLFELVNRWKPMLVVVETVAYQQTLKWLIEKAMREHKIFVPISEAQIYRNSIIDGRRIAKKLYRIIDGIGYAVGKSALFVNKSHGEFIEQYLAYPDVSHDDVIESVANAIPELLRYDDVIDGDYTVLKDSTKPLKIVGGCP